MIRSEGTILFVVLGLAALFSGWVYLTTTTSTSAQDASDQDTPDAFAENIIISTLDTGGRLTQRLWADYSEHLPRDDSTRLTRPYLELYREDGPPWRIKAEHGWIGQEGEEVRLTGQVEFHRERGASNKKTDAYTDAIRFWPDRDYAETDSPVRLEQPGFTTTATGMRAYLDEERVELLSRVHAIQQPKPRKP